MLRASPNNVEQWGWLKGPPSQKVFTINFRAIMLQYNNLPGHESVANHGSPKHPLFSHEVPRMHGNKCLAADTIMSWSWVDR